MESECLGPAIVCLCAFGWDVTALVTAGRYPCPSTLSKMAGYDVFAKRGPSKESILRYSCCIEFDRTFT